MPFTGFPPETFAFLTGLTQNNNKQWFDDHRSDYDQHWVKPAKDFVAGIGPKLRALAPNVKFEPKVNGSIFRINRDVRFSKDKRPYKTTLDLWFWQGEKRGWENPGFFLRLLPAEFIAGAGMHGFSPPQLKKYRAAVAAETSGKALQTLETSLGDLKLCEPGRTSIPRGFDVNHPRAHYLLLEALNATIQAPLPKSIHSAGFLEECIEIFRQAAPLSRWLTEVL